MASFSNFLKFVKGVIKTIKNEGLSSVPTGYKYWKSTSPLLAEFKTADKIYKTTEKQFNFSENKILENYANLTKNNFDLSNFNFELEKTPLVSIIIPTFDNVRTLEKCLTSIEQKTSYKNFEVIIVTNNFDKNSEMRNFLSKQNYKIKFFDNSYSFSAINNFGASFALGDFLLFLNDDTEVITQQWIESMLFLAQDKQVGAVGGKIIYPNNSLQEAGGIIWNNGNVWRYGKNDNLENSNYNFVREVDYCSACMLLIKKSTFEEVGKFNQMYEPSYWEDIDLCLKLKKHGYKILYQPYCEIIHKENQTNPRIYKSIKSILLKNKEKFLKKWSVFISDYPSESSLNLQSAVNKNLGPKTLFVFKTLSSFNLDEIQNIVKFLVVLRSMGVNITFSSSELSKKDPIVMQLQQHGIRVNIDVNNFKNFITNENFPFKVAFFIGSNLENHKKVLQRKMPQCTIFENLDIDFSPSQIKSILTKLL